MVTKYIYGTGDVRFILSLVFNYEIRDDHPHVLQLENNEVSIAPSWTKLSQIHDLVPEENKRVLVSHLKDLEKILRNADVTQVTSEDQSQNAKRRNKRRVINQLLNALKGPLYNHGVFNECDYPILQQIRREL